MPETTNNSEHDVSIGTERGQPPLKAPYGLTPRPPVQQIYRDALNEARVARDKADREAYAVSIRLLEFLYDYRTSTVRATN